MASIFFGSISTVADTSEVQRRAFNEAFAAHDLDWHWSRKAYMAMLDSNGGRQRLDAYAAARGQQVDSTAIHETKSRIFQELLAASAVNPRAGVVDTIREARQAGHKLGFVTTTSPGNVRAVLAAISPHLTADVFDLIVTADSVSLAKPDPAAYEFALKELGEDARNAVAIEDNAGGVSAASAAGVRCVAFPNANTVGSDFSQAVATVEMLDASIFRSLLAP